MKKLIIAAWAAAMLLAAGSAQAETIYARGYANTIDEAFILGVKLAENRDSEQGRENYYLRTDSCIRVLPEKVDGLYAVELYAPPQNDTCNPQQKKKNSIEPSIATEEKIPPQEDIAQWRQKFSSNLTQIPVTEIKAFLREASRDGLLDDAEKSLLAEFANRFEPQAAALHRSVTGSDQSDHARRDDAADSKRLQVGQADVIIDLKRQRAYVDAALVRKDNLSGLIEKLKTEGARKPHVYKNIIAKIAPGGQLIDDLEAYPVVSGHQLGLKGSSNQDRLFVSFPVGSGKAKGRNYLTPTGTFVIGERLINREAKRWDVPSGFNRDPRNPFGPRFLRLNQILADGRESPTDIGLHGTAATATWMNRSDGARAVSHGCVRLPNDVIVRLDRYLQPGAMVQIINGLNHVPNSQDEES